MGEHQDRNEGTVMADPFVAEIRIFHLISRRKMGVCDGQLLPFRSTPRSFAPRHDLRWQWQEQLALPDLPGRAPMHPAGSRAPCTIWERRRFRT